MKRLFGRPLGIKYSPPNRNKLKSGFYRIIYPDGPMTKAEIKRELNK
jgi:hypothetical protein